MFHQTNACAKAAWHGKLYCTAAGGHELTLDLPICAAEARFNATMAFLSGGITIQGDDPRSWLSSERRDLAKRAMPPMEGPPHILDLFDGVGSDWSPGLFVRVVKTSWDSWWVVGHCNGTSAAAAKTIAVSMLPVLSGAQPLEPTEVGRQTVSMGTAVVLEDVCYSYAGRTCGVCYRACPLPGKAMKLGLYETPIVNPEHCVGCGLCEQACVHMPQAIRIIPASQLAQEEVHG